MKGFWKKRNELSELGDEFRRLRPEPRPEFVDELVEKVRAHEPAPQRAPRFPRPRVAFASVLTVAMLVALAATGGLGQAASAGKSAVREVQSVITAPFSAPSTPPTQSVTQVQRITVSAASKEYKPGCGRGTTGHTGPPGGHGGFPGTCPH